MINVHATESGSVKGIIVPLRLFVILSKETQQAAVTIIIITIIVMFRAFFDIYSREKKEEEERITGNNDPFHRAIHGRGRFHFEYEKSMILSMKRSLVIY